MKTKEKFLKGSFIEKILGGFYYLEKIHTTRFEELNKNEYKITFSFLPYTKTLNSLGHVSGNQIHEAVMEGMYLVIGYSIKSGYFSDITLDDFLNLRAVALYREVQIKFKKEIKQSPEEYSLIFTLPKINTLKSKFSVTEIQFKGFCEGKAKAVISTNSLVDNVLKK